MPFSAAKLREHRVRSGLSRAELAEKVGTSAQYISHLENGVRGNPAFDLVDKLGTALGVTCLDLNDELPGAQPKAFIIEAHEQLQQMSGQAKPPA